MMRTELGITMITIPTFLLRGALFLQFNSKISLMFQLGMKNKINYRYKQEMEGQRESE